MRLVILLLIAVSCCALLPPSPMSLDTVTTDTFLELRDGPTPLLTRWLCYGYPFWSDELCCAIWPSLCVRLSLRDPST